MDACNIVEVTPLVGITREAYEVGLPFVMLFGLVHEIGGDTTNE
jgi:hypothetical protein